MLSEEAKQHIHNRMADIMSSVEPLFIEWMHQEGPTGLYEILTDPQYVPPHRPDYMAMAQEFRDNKDETTKILATLLGYV